MKGPKLRIIGGPNGSGKSTLIEELKSKFRFGYYLNADDIEKELSENEEYSFSKFNIKVSSESVMEFWNNSKLNELIPNFEAQIVDNIFYCKKVNVNSYVALVLCEYLRDMFVRTRQSFSFETVMSSESKIELMKFAKELGYRIYLYYICTDSPTINIARVKARVQQNGHNVPVDTIKSRYHRSLKNLLPAILLANRGYIFDNSKVKPKLIAESIDGKQLRFIEKKIPRWVETAIIKQINISAT